MRLKNNRMLWELTGRTHNTAGLDKGWPWSLVSLPVGGKDSSLDCHITTKTKLNWIKLDPVTRAYGLSVRETGGWKERGHGQPTRLRGGKGPELHHSSQPHTLADFCLNSQIKLVFSPKSIVIYLSRSCCRLQWNAIHKKPPNWNACYAGDTGDVG